MTPTHPEELLGGSGVQRAVGDVGLLGQILGALDGRNHPLHGEEGRQVGRVGRDDDEGEEPPDSAHNPARQRPAGGAAEENQRARQERDE